MSFQVFFIEETKKRKENEERKKGKEKILTFMIMNVKIMIEKSFTYACVLCNKCRM